MFSEFRIEEKWLLKKASLGGSNTTPLLFQLLLPQFPSDMSRAYISVNCGEHKFQDFFLV